MFGKTSMSMALAITNYQEAPATQGLGAEGRVFESRRPDHLNCLKINNLST
jgi:hypothetical protein